MIKKNLIGVLLAVSVSVLAQNSTFDRIVPGDDLFATPDVMAFQKQNAMPVSLYTGKIEVTLPIYEVVSGDLTVPISLSYNSGGVKVDDIASNVGLGWSLNASGNVVKIIKDMDDHRLKWDSVGDADGDYGNTPCSFISQKGYFKTYAAVYSNLNGSILPSFCPDWDDWAEEDAAPDLFLANAPGLSVKYILEKNGTQQNYNILPIDGSGVVNDSPINYTNSTVQPLGFTNGELGYDGDPNNNYFNNPQATGSFPRYDKFELVNTSGQVFTFDKADLKEEFNRARTLSILSRHRLYNNYAIGYHLSNITSRKTGKSIDFNYETYQKPSLEYSRYITEEALDDHADIFGGNTVYGHIPLFNDSFNEQQNQLEENIFKTSIKVAKYTEVNRLNEIVFDQGKIEFKYTLTRQDTSDEKALTQILVKDNFGKVIKKFQFSYSYFNSKENCAQKECKRLRLDKIEEIDESGHSIVRYSLDYNYDNPLPKVNSFQQDFLGYYNNNGQSTDPLNILNFQRKHPTLFYYKDQGNNSILPFPLANQAGQTVPGDYSIVPNIYALSGTLKSIEFANGGKSEFEYELHQFNFLGQVYYAGGARIKRQKLTDENQDQRIIDYEYVDDNGNSSGFINAMPVFGYPYVWDKSKTTNNVSFAIFDKSKTALELTSNSFIGYSQVIEKEAGNGYTKYLFESPENVSNEPETYVGAGTGAGEASAVEFLVDNSAYPNSYYKDNDMLRGQLLNKKVFGEGGTLLREQVFEYERDIFQTINLNYRDALLNLKRDHQSQDLGLWRMYHSSALHVERKLNSKETLKEYFDGQVKLTETLYEYDNTYPLLKKTTIDGPLYETTKEISYPFDSDVSSRPFMNQLVLQNRVAEPIKQTTKEDGFITGVVRLEYDDFGNGIYLPAELQTTKLGWTSFITESYVNDIDDKGNILEFNDKSGKSITIIYGYNEALPIAKIENATVNDISAAVISNLHVLSNNDDDFSNGYSGKEGLLRQGLNDLRNLSALSDAKITTYTYNPLVGVTSVTDPKGYTTYYEYDNFNRLLRVKDEQGNILSENHYNYKNQN